MSRAVRLLNLIQILRRHRRPVSGRQLADELGISLRTLYRDIAALQAQGAHIDGAAGLGYLLRPGFMLPPLMFSDEEIEALVLGSRWVARHGDAALATAADNALARIAAVLPPDLRDDLESTTLLVGPGPARPPAGADIARLRQAIRDERMVEIVYRDGGSRESRRRIWPFALGFFEEARVVAAWCELRQGFRHFRTDRIAALTPLAKRYPRRRASLLRAWRAENGIGPQ